MMKYFISLCVDALLPSQQIFSRVDYGSLAAPTIILADEFIGVGNKNSEQFNK